MGSGLSRAGGFVGAQQVCAAQRGGWANKQRSRCKMRKEGKSSRIVPAGRLTGSDGESGEDDGIQTIVKNKKPQTLEPVTIISSTHRRRPPRATPSSTHGLAQPANLPSPPTSLVPTYVQYAFCPLSIPGSGPVRLSLAMGGAACMAVWVGCCPSRAHSSPKPSIKDIHL